MHLKASIETWRKERTTSGHGCALECGTASPGEHRGCSLGCQCRLQNHCEVEGFKGTVWGSVARSLSCSWKVLTWWEIEAGALTWSLAGYLYRETFSSLCFQMYSEIDQKKHPPQLNKIESNNKPTVIFQPVQSWDPWGVVVFQSWSRTAKGSWAWGYCCCSLSVCSEATERSLDLWGVKKHLSHVLRPWSLCKLQRKEKSLVCGSRTDASPWQERLWQVHPC